MNMKKPLVVLALVSSLSGPVLANNISFANTIYDTNYVTSAIGLRDVGTGELSVTGITGTVTRAYLYWHGPTNSTNPAANANVNFNGSSIVGNNIGFSDDNIWGRDNSQAYRADVTSLVAGNGSYTLDNFQKLPDVAINGAALMVFYDDGNSANDRDVVLFHGNDANFTNDYDDPGWALTLSGIEYSSGNANLALVVSDGQTAADGTLQINGATLASGSLFEGMSPKAPGAGVFNGSLFDVQSFDITGFLSPTTTSLTITLDPGFADAVSAVVAAIDLPAGAAPPVTAIPEPGSYLLAGSGLLLAMWRARRRNPPTR